MNRFRDSGPPTFQVIDRRFTALSPEELEAEPVEPRRPNQVEALERELAEKSLLVQELLEQHKSLRHGYDEARVRQQREVAREIAQGRKAMLAELLEVVDNLERALDAASANPDPGVLIDGVAMVRDQFLSKLAGFGVVRLVVVGSRFDPARHEAVTVVPVSDPAQDGQIMGVVREGYRLGDETLRPAAVAVARLQPPVR